MIFVGRAGRDFCISDPPEPGDPHPSAVSAVAARDSVRGCAGVSHMSAVVRDGGELDKV